MPGDYIERINNFWVQDQAHHFSPTETKLYFALLHTANQLSWEETELSIPNGKLLAILGCTKNTFFRARRGLEEKNMIQVTHGDRRNKAPKYTILPCTEVLGQNLTPKEVFGSKIDPKKEVLGQNLTPKKVFGSNFDPKNSPEKEVLGQNLTTYKRYKDQEIKQDLYSPSFIDEKELIDTSTSPEAKKKSKPKKDLIPYTAIGDLFNSLCPSLGKIRGITESRKKHIRARWKEMDSLEKWGEYFSQVEGTPFLTGNNDRGWRATFDWIIAEQNMTKILEGRYTDSKPKKPVTQFDLVRGPAREHRVVLDDTALLEEVLRDAKCR